MNDTFISQHEQTRLANLREAEERLSECTRVIQVIEMKISVSMDENTKLKALVVLAKM